MARPVTAAWDLPQSRARTGFRILLAVFYAAAGVVHLAAPDIFMPVMPGWVPWPHETILFTGACEIAGAVALFPVNINHAMMGQVGNFPATWWYHGPRLALQPVLVWWALIAGGVIDWPFRARREALRRYQR